jgi:hypothetical protein
MIELHFNTEEGAKERAETLPLTLKEELTVVDIINFSIARTDRTDDECRLIQRFLNHYQNLAHFHAVNSDKL